MKLRNIALYLEAFALVGAVGIDKSETAGRKVEIKKLMDELWK